ncbi:MAG: FAD-dependent oxidoreductase [Ruminococcus sp.]|nr:FAD-dependent oxidoreductase [Ruminococcus sp.]
MKTVIIGGVAAGATAAARLRRLDEEAEIIIFEKGDFISFANCGLPYFTGNVIEDGGDLLLQSPESFKARYNIDARVKCEVLKVNPDKKTVNVFDKTLNRMYDESFDFLIISPGSEPIIPDIEGIYGKAVMQSVFIVRTIKDAVIIKNAISYGKAKTAAILGGGAISLEMAENLVNAGLDVSIISLDKSLMPKIDFDISYPLMTEAERHGISLFMNDTITKISKSGENLKITLKSETELTADILIIAAGVRPDTDFLHGSGIELTANGAILTDKFMQTNVKNIYAAGDAVMTYNNISGEPMICQLAGPANKQGRIVADNICAETRNTEKTPYNGALGSNIIRFFDLTAAQTGFSEIAAKKAGFEADFVFTYSPSNASWYGNASMISSKIIFDKKTGKVLGGEFIGKKGIDKRADILATLLHFGGTVDDLTELELCYAPQFSSAKDPVNIAGMAAQNIVKGYVKHIHADEVDALVESGVIFIDVRTEREFAGGHINNAKNIPLDNLRERINEIPVGKLVYVNCRSGQRSYIACRILADKGFDCFNLEGGYRLYSEMV